VGCDFARQFFNFTENALLEHAFMRFERPRWKELFGQTSRSQSRGRSVRLKRELRRFLIESLEDRRLLAVTVNVDGTGLMTIVFDSDGQDAYVNRISSNYFQVGSSSGGSDLWNNNAVTVNAVQVTGAGGTQRVYFEAAAAGAGDMILPGTSSAAAIATDANVEEVNIYRKIDTTTGGANGDLNVSASRLYLRADISTDGGDISVTTAKFIVESSSTIDTESGNNSNAGAFLLLGSGVTMGFGVPDLTVNTGSTGGAGGNIRLYPGNEASEWLNDQLYDSQGLTNGVITITGDLGGGNNGGDVSSITMRGPVQLAASATLDLRDLTADSGSIDFSMATISASVANADLTVNTRATAAGFTSGPITLGVFNNAGGHRVRNLTLQSDSATGTGNSITLTQSPVLTSGTQDYEGAAVLAVNANITAATVRFHETLTGSSFNLDVTGNAVFGNAVADAVTGLGTLRVSGIAVINTATVTSNGTQTYLNQLRVEATAGTATLTTTNSAISMLGLVTLNGNAVFEAGSGNVTFGWRVNGGKTLTINSTGATAFSHPVGADTPLTSLTTNAGGTTSVVNVTTTGVQ